MAITAITTWYLISIDGLIVINGKQLLILRKNLAGTVTVSTLWSVGDDEIHSNRQMIPSRLVRQTLVSWWQTYSPETYKKYTKLVRNQKSDNNSMVD